MGRVGIAGNEQADGASPAGDEVVRGDQRAQPLAVEQAADEGGGDRAPRFRQRGEDVDVDAGAGNEVDAVAGHAQRRERRAVLGVLHQQALRRSLSRRGSSHSSAARARRARGFDEVRAKPQPVTALRQVTGRPRGGEPTTVGSSATWCARSGLSRR